jgi:lipoteichoic acid synthase
MKIPTLSSELKSKDYRTSFFNSGDNHYQKAGEFLSYRGFDRISDSNDSICTNGKFKVNGNDWEYMDGRDDACTASQLLQWIDTDTTKPFFAMMWTYQTHYPYFFRGTEKKYNYKDLFFNRYLNALHYTDSVVGKIKDHLEKTGRMGSTLLVLVGDHGEAFGRHQQVSHGRKVYEENLHVPCLFFNPAFSGTQAAYPGGMVDIAPTIMNFLNYKSPEDWEGESLLSKNENSRVYFFAPWSDYLFGYRHGDRKFIYNATTNQAELYDLATDPFESKNIIKENKEPTRHYLELAAWAQSVNKTTARITTEK